MLLNLTRNVFTSPLCSIGQLSVNGESFCFTLEPPFSGLSARDTAANWAAAKRAGSKAVPLGEYRVSLLPSPRLSGKSFYKSVCGGLVPRLLSVPHFSGVLIHVGNYPRDTAGCILVGSSWSKGFVGSSRATYKALMTRFLYPAWQRGEDVKIRISMDGDF